jgi:hypothetical protein
MTLGFVQCPRKQTTDIPLSGCPAGYWHLTGIAARSADVRYWGSSRHRDFRASCPLMTRRGHSEAVCCGAVHSARLKTVLDFGEGSYPALEIPRDDGH